MKTVFVVHCEELFRNNVPPDFPGRVAELIKGFDQVISLESMLDSNGPLEEFHHLISRTWDWGWGYDPDMFEGAELDWCIESSGHQYTWVPPEVRERAWQWGEVWVAGIFMGECLQDWCDVLDNVGIEYNLLREAIH